MDQIVDPADQFFLQTEGQEVVDSSLEGVDPEQAAKTAAVLAERRRQIPTQIDTLLRHDIDRGA